jgi:hypothetical protein
MKSRFNMIAVLLVTVIFSSCEVVGGIFKAGVWTGIFIVAAIIGLIIFLIARSSNK